MGKKLSKLILALMLILSAAVLSADETGALTDTDLHILAGGVIALSCAATFLFLPTVNDRELLSTVAVAAGAAFAAGIGKELFDMLGFGTPEARDILNTMIGGAIGVATITYSLTAFPDTAISSGSELWYTFYLVSAAFCLPLLHDVLKREIVRRRIAIFL
jgi:hypothetical protein